MFVALTKKIIDSKLFMLIISAVMSYTIWSYLTVRITNSYWFKIPLCFYNHPQSLCFKAPETVSILVSGPRYLLKLLHTPQSSAHVDIAKLHAGENNIFLNFENIIIPPGITVHTIDPYAIKVKATKINESTMQ